MFNKNVIDVLSGINKVTNSIIMKYPKTIAVSDAQDIQIIFDIKNLDSDEFNPLPINDSLNDFLNLCKLFPEDCDIHIKENTIHFNSGKSSSTFILDNIALMEAYDKNEIQFTKTEEAPSVATFDLSPSDMKEIISASSVFKDLGEVIFTSKDGDIIISLGATNKFNAKSNTYSITKDANTSKEFEIKIPIENFKMIPSSEYEFHVKYNSSKNSYRIFMKNKTIPDFNILVAVKV